MHWALEQKNKYEKVEDGQIQMRNGLTLVERDKTEQR